MNKRTKAIAVVVSVLLLAALIVLLTVSSANEAAQRGAEASRNQIKRTFMSNEEEFLEISSLIKESFVYDEICVVFNENGVFVKNDYSNININNSELRQKLLSFAEKTNVDVIYYDSEQVFFKTEFEVGKSKTEANIIIRNDLQKPTFDNCRNLSGSWYYTEFEIA